MKSFIVFAVCVAAALAAPYTSDKDAAVLKNELENLGIGDYRFQYETENGIRAEAQAQPEDVILEDGSRTVALAVRGAYAYTGPDGKTYITTWQADKDGYRATGDHIPVA